MATYYVKKGDAGAVTPVTTLKNSAGDAVNLTGATVRFKMRARGSSTAKVDAAATVVTPASGTVQYEWAAADLDTPGIYEAEYEVTYSGGAIETFPADGYIMVIVRDDIDA